ncbi:MAG: chloride channel protein [Proteobacteria bacterium]|nr:chloride channel protein [Pseudomonadota bacterium]
MLAGQAEPISRRTLRLRYLQRRWRVLFAGVQRDLRSNEMGQIVACAMIGAFVGAITDYLHLLVDLAHKLAFNLPKHVTLSMGTATDHWRLIFVPAIGGLILGVGAWIVRRYRAGEIVDPVEANALFGGRMSLFDSIRLTTMTVISNASGASLGMEAGYSQLGAAVFSRFGRQFRLRREDQRIFVTAGAAAAIAAAFNAPLAGAFYGFELILGSYMPRALAPVAVASVCATLTQQALNKPQPLFDMTGPVVLDTRSYGLFLLMGILAAGVSIVAMQAVTWAERGLRALEVPDWLRPFVGGVVLSFIAWEFPQVLGSGHGAIQYHFNMHWALLPLAALLVAKLVASAISVGSGFRGGLFSSSLFLGTLFGGVFAQCLAPFVPGVAAQEHAFLLVGMGTIAAAIVGAPLTMVFLVLEATGDFPVTLGVLTGVITATTIVRLTFGYSFSTWRFHVRGLGIRGAHDVGWISDLTVARMMRSDPKVVRSDMSLRALRAKYPPGATKSVYAVDPDGRYVGVIDMLTVHNPQIDDVVDFTVVADLAGMKSVFLLPSENVRTALARFDQTQTEALPVLSARADPRVVGYLTEAYALRRYTQELERRRAAELGDENLFSLGQKPGH